MCGRYASSQPLSDLAERFLIDEVRTEPLPPSWNVAPTDPVYAVAEHEGRRLLGSFRWGLIPPGARDPAQGPRPINARAETLVERPLFRDAFARRRCLLPADGFYEWESRDGRKQPYFFAPGEGDVLAMAGLWSTWRREGHAIRTCAIITTSANQIVAPLHDRMPVILPPEHWEVWLDRDEHDLALLSSLLVPAPDELLQPRPVGTEVNSVRNNGPGLTAPVVLP
ncbi:MAG: SOS response-associated peptidase [Acidimicrobiia bacterium]